MDYLVVEHLTKQFQGHVAVHDLWLTMTQGEVLALLGPSGCGKSTTLQLVAGLLHPDAGAIYLEGRPINHVPPERRDMALVLQRGLLFPHLTVGENVAFGLKMRGMNRVDRDKEAIAMLHRVQLQGFEHRKPSELSGGQAQRVALARSLVIGPKLLLLDEPLSALDANLREEMQDLILSLQAQTQVTMLIVTHDQADATVMAQRIALMFDGQLRQVDAPERLYRYPCDEATARFMGGVNFFTVQAEQHQWHLPNGLRLTSTLAHQGPLRVTLRPEALQVYTDAAHLPRDLTGNCLQGEAIANRFTGTQRRITVAIAPNLNLQAWGSPTQDIALGQTVWLYIPPDALWGLPSEPCPPVSIPSPAVQS
ncbi:MAG: ABC transporter ATP-binding protein [Elainellaceae cyanobacterium]